VPGFDLVEKHINDLAAANRYPRSAAPGIIDTVGKHSIRLPRAT